MPLRPRARPRLLLACAVSFLPLRSTLLCKKHSRVCNAFFPQSSTMQVPYAPCFWHIPVREFLAEAEQLSILHLAYAPSRLKVKLQVEMKEEGGGG